MYLYDFDKEGDAMIYFFLALFIIFLIIMYERYFPVYGIPCIEMNNQLASKNVIFVDVRDYNDSSNKPIDGAVMIPVAYLSRFINEIPRENIHVIASTTLEKNVGIRILRKQGFKVNSYTIIDCRCKKAELA